MQIGVILREAREEQGLSLDDIQEITKIQKRYLVAIEHDDFHALPGRFYARAFIKEYAQAVGLDPAIILADFDEGSIQQGEQEENVPYTRFDRSRRTEEKSSSILSFLPTVIVVILVIGIIFVAYTLMQKSSTNSGEDVEIPQENDEIIREKDNKQKPEDTDEEQDEGENTSEEDEVQTEDGAESSRFEVLEVGEGNSPLSTIDFIHNEDELILGLDATSDVYVQIQNGNEQVLFEGSLTESTDVDDLDVSDEERVYLNIGNASGLSVTMNGEKLEYPVDANEKVHQKMWINLKKED